ncbi:hypothetical protein OpiT1DRAFT_00782 [Opitutaceae bacterium TAV1]|nr:hypothetical protein OpiT1DRAFT_00782 [Opitutaceae bacterium TAV1]
MNKHSRRHTSSCEFLGTFRFIEKLLSEGLAVAKPLVDDGVDLIVYADRKPLIDRFAAVPIQLKCYSEDGFIVDEKYGKIEGLFIAYIWFSGDHSKLKIYVLPYSVADALAKKRNGEPFKRTKGIFTTTSVPAHVKDKLRAYERSKDFFEVFFRSQENA